MKNALGLCFLALFLAHSCWAFDYPQVWRNESMSDDYFGQNVPDPYRWLEDVDLDETKLFVEQQNALTSKFIQTNTQRGKVWKSMRELYTFQSYGIPVKHGDKYYLSIRDGNQNQAILYSLKSLDNEDREVFIDPNVLSANGTSSLAFTIFSEDARYCAYGISAGGSDWITIKIRNVQTLQDLDEILTKIKFSYVGWVKDEKEQALGFFYGYFDTYNGTGDGTETVTPENQKVFYHKLKTDQTQDIMIMEFPEHPKWLVGTPTVSKTGNFVHLFPTEGTSNTPWLFAKFDPNNIKGKLDFKWIVESANAEYGYVGDDDKCTYIKTNWQAPNFRLVCVDLSDPAPTNWKNILAENPKSVLTSTLVVNEKYLVAVYMINVVDSIQIHELSTGKHLFDVHTPIGHVSSIYGEAKDTEFFYRFTSFLTPAIIYRYDFSATPNRITVYKESKIATLNADDFIANQIFYPSKDGTLVPMFLVHRKNLLKNAKNPTMLYAYGGFNINIQPGYDALGIFFAKHFDGIYAVANLRGGGEFGEQWHKQGMRHNKQNVFDDFAAAGQWLIDNKYTSRQYLTINGRSNGGLLVGACSNQFPHIFGASIANVGVMDMLRFAKFTIGYAWVEEYGDPINKEEDFKTIIKYSPLHTIKSEMSQYPNMLVLTADHDDRVVPAHSYKFIAELQHKLGEKLKDTPLMIRIDANSGHGAGKPVFKWIDEYTDIACFLMNTLNYSFHP